MLPVRCRDGGVPVAGVGASSTAIVMLDARTNELRLAKMVKIGSGRSLATVFRAEVEPAALFSRAHELNIMLEQHIGAAALASHRGVGECFWDFMLQTLGCPAAPGAAAPRGPPTAIAHLTSVWDVMRKFIVHPTCVATVAMGSGEVTVVSIQPLAGAVDRATISVPLPAALAGVHAPQASVEIVANFNMHGLEPSAFQCLAWPHLAVDELCASYRTFAASNADIVMDMHVNTLVRFLGVCTPRGLQRVVLQLLSIAVHVATLGLALLDIHAGNVVLEDIVCADGAYLDGATVKIVDMGAFFSVRQSVGVVQGVLGCVSPDHAAVLHNKLAPDRLDVLHATAYAIGALVSSVVAPTAFLDHRRAAATGTPSAVPSGDMLMFRHKTCEAAEVAAMRAFVDAALSTSSTPELLLAHPWMTSAGADAWAAALLRQ